MIFMPLASCHCHIYCHMTRVPRSVPRFGWRVGAAETGRHRAGDLHLCHHPPEHHSSSGANWILYLDVPNLNQQIWINIPNIPNIMKVWWNIHEYHVLWASKLCCQMTCPSCHGNIDLSAARPAFMTARTPWKCRVWLVAIPTWSMRHRHNVTMCWICWALWRFLLPTAVQTVQTVQTSNGIHPIFIQSSWFALKDSGSRSAWRLNAIHRNLMLSAGPQRGQATSPNAKIIKNI